MDVPIDRIVCRERIRAVSPETVDALAVSIGEVGLLNPLTVGRATIMNVGQAQNGYRLISGLHRLEAVKKLGWTEVSVTVLDLIGPAAVIAECDENLCGTNLSKVERALFMKHRKEAYLALHPETKVGAFNQHTVAGRQLGDEQTRRFTADTAAKTGRSERDVQRDVERGDNIPEEMLKDIAGTSLDNGVVLDTLAHAPDPQAALDAMKRERNHAEAHRRNREADRTVALTEAEQFADWLFGKMGKRELPMIISWLECCKPKQVTAALRRMAA